MELLFALLLLLFVAVLIRWRAESSAVEHAMARRQGLHLVPDTEIPLVTQRVQELIQPLPLLLRNASLWKPGPVYSLTVGGRDAFLYELRYTAAYSNHNYQRACVVLGAGAPYLRATPRGLLAFRETRDFPAVRCIDFPQDRRFSKAFCVAGTNEVAIRSYLGPQLRQFLLAHAKGWRFNAGPEGVALLHCGRTPSREMSRVAVSLERLAVAAEATRL